MDADVRNFLAVVNNARQPPIDQVPIAEIRRQFEKLKPIFHPYVALGHVADHQTDSGVMVRVYSPRAPMDGESPAIVYFHGGGWVMGNVGTHDTLCRQLALHSDCIIVSVDYRLAPEHPFPQPFEDAWEAVNWVVDRAAHLGINARRVGVAGDSAGGNLALSVALRARERGGPRLAGGCLLYPVLDSRCDSESYFDFGIGHGLTADKMRYFWNAYLGDHPASDPVASPAFATDFSGLPPTLVLTAEYDVLRDEGAEMARRLRTAGNDVDYRCCEGVIHGFIHFAGAIEKGRSELRETGRRLGTLLRRTIV